jgi:hypothetical protein
MSKTRLLISCLVLISFTAFSQQVKTPLKQPFYYQIINNANSSVNFAFGLYPATIKYFQGKNFPPYTAIRTAIFNKSSKDVLKWDYYKVDILLKSGKLISNYAPFSKEAPYICNYTVPADSTHYQFFCFHTKFTAKDIDKVWLRMNDDEIFGLNFDKNK